MSKLSLSSLVVVESLRNKGMSCETICVISGRDIREFTKQLESAKKTGKMWIARKIVEPRCSRHATVNSLEVN